MPSEDFFYRAFGESEKEFRIILHMPEKLLMSRGKTEGSEEIEWKTKFNKLTKNEKDDLVSMLCRGRTQAKLLPEFVKTTNGKLKKILEHYLPEQDKSAPKTKSLFEGVSEK